MLGTFSLSLRAVAVYGVDGNLDPSFLRNIQQILRDMARLSSELSGVFEFKFDYSEPISRVSATLNLYYHQVCSTDLTQTSMSQYHSSVSF